MSDPKKSRIQELEERREAALAARQSGRDEQYEKDLEARIDLEEDFGTVVAVKVSRFVPGQPTMALVRSPNAAEYKRYKDHVFAHAQAIQSGKKSRKTTLEAQEELARACWVYPAPPDKEGDSNDPQKAMLEVFAGLLSPLGAAASALAEGAAEGEGKD